MPEQPGRRPHLARERRGVEDGGDLGAGPRILIGGEIEKRRAAEEDRAPANGAALMLQRHLGAAQAKDAGQGPAAKGKHPSMAPVASTTASKATGVTTSSRAV